MEHDAPDPGWMSFYCQRCGAHARQWRVSIETGRSCDAWYNALLCGICTRSVLSEVETTRDLTERVLVYLSLEPDR